MKSTPLSTAIAIAFFLGTLLITFSSSDSHVVAMRILLYLAAASAVSIASFYLMNKPKVQKNAKMDYLLKDAQKFSQEYGDLYVLADKMKQQRKHKQSYLLSKQL